VKLLHTSLHPARTPRLTPADTGWARGWAGWGGAAHAALLPRARLLLCGGTVWSSKTADDTSFRPDFMTFNHRGRVPLPPPTLPLPPPFPPPTSSFGPCGILVAVARPAT